VRTLNQQLQMLPWDASEEERERLRASWFVYFDSVIDRARLGDPKAYATLAYEFEPLMHRMARRFAGPQLAEDALQESLYKFMARLRQYKGDGASLIAWLRALVRTTSLDLLEQERHRAHAELSDDLVSPADLEAEIAASFDAHLVLEEIRKLPPAIADAVCLRVLCGWRFRDIEERTGIPAVTLRSYVHRVRTRLAARLVEAA
jgi:RNA polymerase sigma-70 factor, ECF subfamily